MFRQNFFKSSNKIFKKLWKSKILSICLILTSIAPLSAQNTSLPLRVATKTFAPFAFEENGEYVGFSIDLWKEIAKDLDLEYQLYGEKTIVDLLKSVSDDDTDVAIAGITITSEREKQIDFSYPFFESGLQVLVPIKKTSPLISFFRFLFSPILLSAITFLLIVIIISAHLIWLVERQKNPQMFPKEYLKGIGEACWWAVVTVVTVGYGDKTPLSLTGRVIATIWMFTGILLISYFTASVTSALTIQNLSTEIKEFKDLGGKQVATLKGTTAAKYLENRPIKVLEFNTFQDAIEAVKKEKADAIVYDFPVLLYYTKSEGFGKFQVVGKVFEQQSYGIALKTQSPYRESINQSILRLKENGTYQKLYEKWFGME